MKETVLNCNSCCSGISRTMDGVRVWSTCLPNSLFKIIYHTGLDTHLSDKHNW